jgi:energy-coupling factor transporter transmembrane protein EcfT
VAIEFQKGESSLHRLDARTKILLFVSLTVVAVIIIDPLMIALLFLVLYGFGARAVERGLLNRNLRVLVAIFATFSMFQILFFTPEDAFLLFYLIPGRQWIPVTVEGMIRGVAVFFRFFIVVLSVHLMLYTTPPVHLVLGLTRREQRRGLLRTVGITLLLGAVFYAAAWLAIPEEIARLPGQPQAQAALAAVGAVLAAFAIFSLAARGLPPEMGLALSIGFATVGILSQQTQRITDAQKARGYDVKPKNLIRRMGVLTALLLPIFLATLERSQDIAVAILARAFDYNISARTYRQELRFRAPDYILMAVMVGLILGGLALNAQGAGNPTEQFVLRALGA